MNNLQVDKYLTDCYYKRVPSFSTGNVTDVTGNISQAYGAIDSLRTVRDEVGTVFIPTSLGKSDTPEKHKTPCHRIVTRCFVVYKRIMLPDGDLAFPSDYQTHALR
jgi:hypothetical protein